MSTETRIFKTLKQSPRPLDDDEIAAALGVVRQQINQAARRLEASKKLIRVKGPSGKLVNVINDRKGRRLAATMAEAAPAIREGTDHLTEDEVKKAVSDYLTAAGYEVKVAWDRAPGIDIEAERKGERLVIEAKGEVALNPQQHNYFLGALGELVQRMDDPNARYGLALPNNRQYYGLVDRLPDLAKQRMGFVVYWVERGPDGPRVAGAKR